MYEGKRVSVSLRLHTTRSDDEFLVSFLTLALRKLEAATVLLKISWQSWKPRKCCFQTRIFVFVSLNPLFNYNITLFKLSFLWKKIRV